MRYAVGAGRVRRMYCGRSRWVARREYAGVGVRSGSGVVLLSYLHCFLPCLVDPLLLDVTRGPSNIATNLWSGQVGLLYLVA